MLLSQQSKRQERRGERWFLHVANPLLPCTNNQTLQTGNAQVCSRQAAAAAVVLVRQLCVSSSHVVAGIDVVIITISFYSSSSSSSTSCVAPLRASLHCQVKQFKVNHNTFIASSSCRQPSFILLIFSSSFMTPKRENDFQALAGRGRPSRICGATDRRSHYSMVGGWMEVSSKVGFSFLASFTPGRAHFTHRSSHTRACWYLVRLLLLLLLLLASPSSPSFRCERWRQCLAFRVLSPTPLLKDVTPASSDRLKKQKIIIKI